jgi:predicted DNA-binding mobile mystery protein A
MANSAVSRFSDVETPPEGWIVTMRKALGMSGAQLARRLGITRAAISHTEKQEMIGGVTLKHMQKTAEAMGCRFVYAIVPDGCIEDVIRDQAERKATELVRRASGHMALENQSLPLEKIQTRIARLSNDLMRDMPSDFWGSK